MNKIERPARPTIKIYTEKKFKLNAEQRAALLTLISPQSPNFKSFIPRLSDPAELFTKAERETLLAIAYYGNPENFKDGKKITTKKAPTFSAYKDKELKKHLSKIFNAKCAYCDSEFLAVGNADIEHFRPKAAFNPFRNNQDESLIAPGYYWLAADWDNLLWSCLLCNRKNNLAESNSEELKPLGKKNRFPVSIETSRVRSHNDDLSIENKIKLILDPCVDDPTEHFIYPMEDHVLGIVQSKLTEQNQPSLPAEASIPIYGLNRVELVRIRERTALAVKGNFTGMLRTLQLFIPAHEAWQKAQEAWLQKAKDAGEEKVALALEKEVLQKAEEDWQKAKETDQESSEEAKEVLKFEKEALDLAQEALQLQKEFGDQKKLFNDHLSAKSPYLAMKQFLLEDFKEIPLLNKLGVTVEGLIDN